MRRHASKVLGLAMLAILGVMAMSATAAQAEVELPLKWGTEPGSGEAGFFLSEKVERPKGLTEKENVGTETVSGDQIGSSRLLIPKKSAEIVCEEAKVTGAEHFIQNEYNDYSTEPATMKKGGHGHGELLFLKCKVNKINPTTGELEGELKACTEELNKELLATLPASHHVTAHVLILVRRHAGVTYIVAEPLINSHASYLEAAALTLPFSTLHFGGLCSLPKTVNVTGGVATKAPTTDSNKPELNVNTFSAEGKKEQELLGLKLNFGESEAFIEGKAKAELTGGGAALNWGAM